MPDQNRPTGAAAQCDLDPRTTLARATTGYNETFERAVVEAIAATIAAASRTSDCDCIALRTGETAGAFLSCLAAILAISPAVTPSPTAMRQTVDELGKRLHRRVEHRRRVAKEKRPPRAGGRFVEKPEP